MRYKEQVKSLVDIFKSGEKSPNNFKLGLELEHFILNKDDLTAVSYYEDKGVEDILKELVRVNWEPEYEGAYLIKLIKDKMTITLEPGGQLELSLAPVSTIKEIDLLYQSFLDDIFPILLKWDKVIVNLGYHPESGIKNIPLLPKNRYKYMYEYFKNRGRYAHNMMKGTASIQVSLDYQDEDDYRKKIISSYYLSPIIYCIFDNGPFFEGKLWDDPASIRSIIWDNCDNDRCGLIKGIFKDEFGYKDYASYILNCPPIIIKKDGNLVFTGDTSARELLSSFISSKISKEELMHLLTMVFPDVRTKKYLEIRIGDSLPYPYFLGFVALWKGLLYNKENLDYLYSKAGQVDKGIYFEYKNRIQRHGYKAFIDGESVISRFRKLKGMASIGLTSSERKYLDSLDYIIENGPTPKEITYHNLKIGKKEALQWCMVPGKDDFVASTGFI
ncbi:glutamate--cysteine ligase [Halothermothrix orenii]|uniref:Glutamate--cysteine ligase n=1 Tax=Halothermothrix orenii (strain H 168 / OCM 544 / DSM 9562) TaxID=373903 RepID=B8CWC8_HALOH|nr:glutamate-cysteine ligase family protein [Halothermothrix orenii]ACL69597.1 Glutamate--cysteine ligase [Halothermothrix orenii H 168]